MSARPGRRSARVKTSLGPVTPVRFAGRVVRTGELDAAVVRAIQRRLAAVGSAVTADGIFGPETEGAVKLFQARFPDVDGQPLKVDGHVGAITWAALFGRESVPVFDTAPPLLAAALRVAASQIGVVERPSGSNRGPEVDRYLRSVGLDPAASSHPWCAAFVYFCFATAAKQLGRRNPVVRTAGVLDHWDRARAGGIATVTAAKAHIHEQLVRPGQIFIIDTGSPGVIGHTGLVARVAVGKLVTIEGNTNDGGSREGIGVFQREARRIRDINVGFIDYRGA